MAIGKYKQHPVSTAMKRLRKIRGLSQQALAVKLGMAISTIARWETSDPPSGEVCLRFDEMANDDQSVFLRRYAEYGLSELLRPANATQRLELREMLLAMLKSS